MRELRSLSRGRAQAWIVTLGTLAMLMLPTMTVPLLAQSVSGSISGTIVDQSRQVIVGATVTLTNERTGDTRVVPSNEIGDFLFASVQPGLYTIKVELSGFSPYQRTNTVLSANDRLSLGTIELRAGGVAEGVTVTAEGTPVQTRSSERSALITSRQLEMMPVLGRDVQTVLRTLPGVRFDTGSDDAYNYLPGINGQGSGAATFAIDGLSANDLGGPDFLTGPPNFDAVAEVKVLINSYQAEYGRNSGALINVVTKSGTKDYKGSAYWYKRHEMWNATPFFNNALDVDKPRYRYSTAGANLGGPVPVKRLKDRMFFFYAYEHLAIRDPQPFRRVTMPTVLERQGDFSQSFDQAGNLIVIRDPATGQPFPGNKIPADRINASGQALLNFFPVPNRTDRALTNGEYNYLFQESVERPRNRHDGRIDHRLSDRDAYYMRFGWSQQDHRGYAVPAGSSNWGLIAQHYLQIDRTLTGTYTRLFGSSVVNELSVGSRYNTEDGSPLSDEGLRRINRDAVGFTVPQFYPQNNPLNVLPYATFGGVPSAVSLSYESRFPLNGSDTWLTANDVLTATHGTHTFKAGLYLEWVHNIEGRRGTFPGAFDFSRDVNNPLDSGNPFGNALLGNFRAYSESTSRNGGDATAGMLQWFAQDTWRAARTLNLDYGVRFATYSYWNQRVDAAAFALERYDPARAPRLYYPRVVDGQRVAFDPVTGGVRPAVFIGAFVPDSGNTANGMVLDSDPTYPHGFREPPGLLVQPRLGVSYDPVGDGRTAIRAAAGVFHQVALGSVDSWNAVTNPPAQYTPTIFYENMDRLPALSATGAGAVRPTAVSGWARDGKTPVVYNFTAGAQRDIGYGTVVDVAYVGTRSRFLERSKGLNVVPYGARFLAVNRDPTTGGALSADYYRPYPGLAAISLIENVGYANYDSLQLAVNRRFTRGLQFGLAYTWSKTYDVGNVPTYQPLRDWTYGPAGDHQPHVLVINYTWELPRASRVWNTAVVRAALDGWQLAGVTAFASGYPFTPSFATTDGQDIWGGGDGGWAIRTGDPNLSRGDRTFDRWFDTSVFRRPTADTFGTRSRNVIQGPGYQNWDVSLFKHVPLGGHRSLQFRLEAYNAFNHTQWSNINTAANFDPQGQQVNANFGRVTDTRAPRRLQMGLRVSF